jgi:hypothetical protein
MLAGAAALRSNDSDGLEVGVFGWADASGLVSNTKLSGVQRLGLILPLMSFRPVPPMWGVVPPGYQVTLATAGDFYVRFPNGAEQGQPVYASLFDGTPISGETPDADLTPWTVIARCAPGGLAIISTWSN